MAGEVRRSSKETAFPTRRKNGGFRRVLLRGDTDFSQTKHLDRWTDDGRVQFIFGLDSFGLGIVIDKPGLSRATHELWARWTRSAMADLAGAPPWPTYRAEDRATLLKETEGFLAEHLPSAPPATH